MLLSLFCGAGGLDRGFEQAGFSVGLAYDIREQAIKSYNANRGKKAATGLVFDISQLDLQTLDKHFGSAFLPTGVIGGPPCQSFSKANAGRSLDDPRAKLVERFVSIVIKLHQRNALEFAVMENVPELVEADDGKLLGHQKRRLEDAGFVVSVAILDAADFGVPQRRRRMFLVALNQDQFPNRWAAPKPTVAAARTVKQALSGLPEPTFFNRDSSLPAYHPNHWCMVPKSPRFFDGTLREGYSAGRSFKTLRWDRPSLAVSYGNREVHVHPSGRRRLSVYEAMVLQGFEFSYVLQGTLSAQISQVSEAVPPPLARAVAVSVAQLKNEIQMPAKAS